MSLFDAADAELRARLEAVDWAATALGPVERWSSALRTAVELTLNTRFAITLLWGDEYVMIYNSAYARIIADKHPGALGRRCADVFPEAWDTIGPMLDSVVAGDGATWVEDLPLPLYRNGQLSEAYFTFSYSPVGDGAGGVEGVIDITAESTSTVIDRRRLELLARLQEVVGDLDHVSDLQGAALALLREQKSDFTDVELVGADDVPPTEHHTVVVPLTTFADTRAPVLVVRLSPQVRADEPTREFVRLVASTLARARDRVEVAESDAKLSEALQRSLLTSPANAPGLDVGVRYLPAGRHAQVGGDWFDSFGQPDGTSTLVVGDVMGHDRDAAAVMGQIRNLLRGVAHSVRGTPATVLGSVDRAIGNLGVGALATAVVATVEPAGASASARAVRWASAGHLPPVLRRADGSVELLDARPDLLLGLDPHVARRDHALSLDVGDVLVLYTDGLVERRDRALDDGLARLAETLGRHGDEPVETLCDTLLAERGGTGEDDVALLVLRVTG